MNNLPNTLDSLAQRCRQYILESSSQAEHKPILTEYYKTTVEKLEYKEGNLGIVIAGDTIVKTHYPRHLIFALIEQINQWEEHEYLLGLLEEQYALPKAQAEPKIHRLLQALVDQAHHLTDHKTSSPLNLITQFIRDLDNAPINWSVSVWINGIWLTEDQYVLEDGLIIRRPIKEDIEEQVVLEHSFYHSNRTMSGLPSSILEFKYRAIEQAEVDEQIFRILNILRLYKLGAIQELKSVRTPESVLRQGSTTSPHGQSNALGKYRLSSEDLPVLTAFYKRMLPITPTKPSNTKTNPSPLDISYDRFCDALLTTGSFENRIMHAITALESILLKSNEPGELSHRLAQRCAALIQPYTQNSIRVYNNIKHAYNIRSTYVHGGQHNTKNPSKDAQLARDILEYTRIALVIFFQTQNELEKDALIKRLDYSLLEATTRNQLMKLLDQVLVLNPE